MGKKQHSKDKMHVLQSEWAETGGYKSNERAKLPYRQLPYDCCAMSLQPFLDPVCTSDGCVFDIMNILPYVTKYKKNPVNGEPLNPKQLFPLHFHKNAEGQFHCPVMYKPFTVHSHIVAIRTTGNVYSYEAIKELVLKGNNFKDLLTDEPFKKDDIIHIQDPYDFSKRDVNSFAYVKAGQSFAPASVAPAVHTGESKTSDLARIMQKIGGGPKEATTSTTTTTTSSSSDSTAAAAAIIGGGSDSGGAGGGGGGDEKEGVEKKRKENEEGEEVAERMRGELKTRAPAAKIRRVEERVAAPKPKIAVAPTASYVQAGRSSGSMALAFTSTALDVVTTQTSLKVSELERRKDRAQRVRKKNKKGYVRLVTSLGNINVELRCDKAPLTCDNFISLCRKGYYDKTIFHRLIKGFMIQGGDPTGTGRGGECAWGGKFEDEFHPHLKHEGPGILSMANAGKHTNGSQFFITFRSVTHLDNIHTVFGKVVGGMEIVKAMEQQPVDSKDRPRTEITLLSTEVFVDPYSEDDEEQEALAKKTAEDNDAELQKRKKEDSKGEWYSNPVKERPEVQREGIGKYLNLEAKPTAAAAATAYDDEWTAPVPKPKPFAAQAKFGNFDTW